MNGYSNNGFTKSLNGILSITDGMGTTIENGAITTTSMNVNGNITATGITVNGNITATRVLTNIIDSPDRSAVLLFNNTDSITIGQPNWATVTSIPAYLECGFCTFDLGIVNSGYVTNYGVADFLGVTNFSGLTNAVNITDSTSLDSTASLTVNGGMIVKNYLYATDVMQLVTSGVQI